MNKYIVSLTTIPSKFNNLHKAIDSLINQTILPEKIVINIPKLYSFRFNNKSIDLETLHNFIDKYKNNNVVLNLIDKDFGPGTKLVGLLNSKLIENDDNTYIILVDDDYIYKPYMIEDFDNHIKKYSNIEVASYWVYGMNGISIGQGADGFFIKQNILTNFLQFYNEIKDEDYVNFHDDYYISYYCNLINKQIHYIKPPNNCLIYDDYGNKVDGLFYLDGKYCRNNLNSEVHNVLNRLKENNKFSFLN